MKEKLDNIIAKLNQNKFFAVTVINLDTHKNIVCNNTAEKLNNTYGSVNNFFDTIFDNGVNKIGVRTRKKNGSNWKDGPEPYLEYTRNGEIQQPNNVATQQAQTIAPIVYPQPTSLNGAISLGLPELLNYNTALNEKVRLEERNKYLEIRNTELEKANSEHRENEMKARYSHEERQLKAESNNKMLETATPLLAPLIEKLMGAMSPSAAPVAAVVQGLGNPNNSEVKNQFLNMVEQMPDVNINILGCVHNGFKNQDFSNELIELMQKYNLYGE